MALSQKKEKKNPRGKKKFQRKKIVAIGIQTIEGKKPHKRNNR